MKTEQERRSKATQLVELTEARVELWHDTEGQPWAKVPVGDHYENWPLGSRPFSRWIRREFYSETGQSPARQTVQDALGVLEAKAVFAGPEHPVFTRLAEHGGSIYLDLSNEAWECVEITTTGWEVMADPPGRFRRSKGMLPLPLPARGGTISDLRRFINVASERDWVLLVSCLVASFRPKGPYPVLVVHGEQGSAKSTGSRVMRRMVDTNKADLRSAPKEPRDLMIAATNGWYIALDNLSHLPGWLSDALCRLSTGGGFGTRTLYENDEETLFDAQRPVILNGIEELATRGDLMERAVLLYLSPIPDGMRRPEKEFWEEFEAARPAILGVVLDVVSTALRDVKHTHLDELPRMADFFVWSVAAAPALGWDGKWFMEAYRGNQSSANELTLEASPVSALVLELSELGDWEGTATQLLKVLSDMAYESTTRLRSWPKDARTLSNILRTLSANLRKKAVEVDFGQTPGRNSIKPITIRKVVDISDASDASDADHEYRGEAGPQWASQSDAGVAKIPTFSKDQWELEL